MRRVAAWMLLAAVAERAPAAEQGFEIDLPPGTLGASVSRLAQQAAISVSIDDAALARRQVTRVRGRMTPAAAVQALARSAGADATRVGGSSWRLTIARRAPPPPPPRPRPAPVRAPQNARDAEIVVLASKRGIPLASMASSVEVIEAPPTGIEAGTSALVTRSTILSSTQRGQGREKLFLRGLADLSFAARLQSMTGMYFGDVRMTYSAADPSLQLYDLASVELLQGPQGTLYGSGSMGGIIRLNPNMPERGVASGSIGAGLSTVAHGGTGADADAVVNLPVTDRLAVRVLGYARADAGFIDKPALGRDVNRQNVAGGRVIARWWPRDDWTVDAIAMRQTIRARDNQYGTAGAPPLVNLDKVAEPFGGDYAAGHVVVNGRLGDVALTSATGVGRQRFHERTINSGTFFYDVARDHDLLTHETRLSGGDGGQTGWIAGLSYTATAASARSDNASLPRSIAVSSEQSVGEVALFAEGTVRVAPFLFVGAGGRVVQARSAIRQTSVSGTFATSTLTRQTERWLMPTGSILLRPTPTLSAYVRYQQGRRPDAASSEEDTPAGSGRPAERIASLDAGVRWRSDGGANVTMSIQHSRWRSLQVDFFEPFFAAYLKFDDWVIDSAHARLRWPVTQRLWLDVAAARNRSRPTSEAFRAIDLRLPDIADVIARGAMKWTGRVGARTSLNVEAWARYEGAFDTLTLLYRHRMERGYARVGLNLDIVHGHGAVILSLDNLLDERGPRYLAGTALRAGQTTTPLQPRTVRVGYRRSF